MDLTEAEFDLLLAATTAEDAKAQAVLADVLLERGHPLGELLRLEAEARDLPRRRELERELRGRLRHALTPWAKELEFNRGLPGWALFASNRQPLPEAETDAGWPVPAATVTGEFRSVLPLLRSRAIRRLRELDFSPMWASSPFTMWVGEPPPPLEPLSALTALALPHGEVPPHWIPILTPALGNVREVTVGLGPGFVLPPWALALPKLKKLRLVPGREPPSAEVVDAAVAWQAAGEGRTLECLGETLDGPGLLRALRPALPGARAPLPAETSLRLTLEPEGPTSRVFRSQGAPMRLLRADDAPPADAFAAPSHPALVRPTGLVRIGGTLFVELERPGEPLPLERLLPATAVRLTAELLDALEAWWGSSAPDVVWGEWVGLGRDQLRRRDDGRLALIPVLTRCLAPEVRTLCDLAGIPLSWNRTATMMLELGGSLLFEWLTGLPFLDALEGSPRAVHRRLAFRRAHPPRPSEVDPALQPFDELVVSAFSGEVAAGAWRDRLVSVTPTR